MLSPRPSRDLGAVELSLIVALILGRTAILLSALGITVLVAG